MTAHEERALLMQAAEDLRVELHLLNKRANHLINKLIGEADGLAIAAADEKEAGEHRTRKLVTYGKAYGAGPEKVAEMIAPTKQKRTCRTCGQPGHNARTCPKANEAYRATRGKGKKK